MQPSYIAIGWPPTGCLAAVATGAALVTVILISLVNLIADTCQAVLDPRVHLI